MTQLITVPDASTLIFEGKRYRCAIGKGGFSVNKQEGDGATPVGEFLLRECYYRPDKISVPVTALPTRPTNKESGWCDDPASADYNHLVKLPCAASHELMWRDDDIYDLVVVIGYNDAPVLAGRGSAIFMHVAKPDYTPTEGCVALNKQDLLELLSQITEPVAIRLGI